MEYRGEKIDEVISDLKLFSIKEVSELLEYSKNHIYSLVKDGKLKAYKQSPQSKLRFSKNQIREYLESIKVGG